MYLREPVVSGQFYPSDRKKLLSLIESYVNKKDEKIQAKAVISPHAGYIYSGSTAGLVYSSVNIPDRVIILCPNHTGMGSKFALMREGIWETPLGKINIDSNLAEIILKKSDKLKEDVYAHLQEHSLEVQLPFIQYLNPNATIVPISIMGGSYKELDTVGKAIADAIKEYDKETLIVVSSDMSHYIAHEEATKRDAKAIEKIIALDGEGLIEVCRRHDITMCGVYPAVTGISAAKTLGAKSGNLLKYTTSAEVSGDYRHVVGYAGIVLY